MDTSSTPVKRLCSRPCGSPLLADGIPSWFLSKTTVGLKERVDSHGAPTKTRVPHGRPRGNAGNVSRSGGGSHQRCSHGEPPRHGHAEEGDGEDAREDDRDARGEAFHLRKEYGEEANGESPTTLGSRHSVTWWEAYTGLELRGF